MFENRFLTIRRTWSDWHEALGRISLRFSRRFPRLARSLGVLKRRHRPIRAGLHVLLHVAGFLFSLEAVMQTRTEQGAVAWALSLNTVPVVAVPAWIVFGDSNLESYITARRAGLEETRPFADLFIKNLESAEGEPDWKNKTLTDTLERLASMPMTRGNHVELLVDGENTYRSMFEAIDKAEDYILVQFYILRADETGGEFKERLIQKAKQGVRVWVLVDNYGSLKLPKDYLAEMEEAGIQTSFFMDLSGKANRFQLNFRNHRKIVVVDGKTGFVGGHNVGDEYRGKHPSLTPWRDSHIRMTGPVVKTLQVPFVEDWHWATGTIPDDLDWSISGEDFVGSVEALCLATGPADPMETCAMFFLTVINQAQERVWIASPYFVPDDKLVTALQLAAVRGVDVRVLLPGMNDSQLVHFSSFSYLDELETAGVKVYRYEKGFLHQKVALVDRSLAAIGSANFDNRSFRLNFEVTGIVHDEEFGGEVEEMLLADFQNSRLIGAEDYAEKPFYFRLLVHLARLLAPIQ